jgi:hypothetical protein
VPISQRTVTRYVEHIQAKLEEESRTAAANLAVRNLLIRFDGRISHEMLLAGLCRLVAVLTQSRPAPHQQ